MELQQLIQLYTQDQRINTTYPDSRREVLPLLVRHVGINAGGEGAIIYSKLDESNADDLIRSQIAYFRQLGQNFEWKVYDYDTPPHLHERLAQHGFTVEEPEAIMVLDLAEAPATLFQPTHHDIRRITRPADLADVQSVGEAVWQEEKSSLMNYLADVLTNQPQLMSIYAAYVDGVAASAAWAYFPEGSQFASLWGGSTRVEYRGQGLYSALLAVRAQEAQSRGVRFLTVDASPMSRPILEKLGFVKIAESYPCQWAG